jgi:hypothetical protein
VLDHHFMTREAVVLGQSDRLAAARLKQTNGIQQQPPMVLTNGGYHRPACRPAPPCCEQFRGRGPGWSPLEASILIQEGKMQSRQLINPAAHLN